MTEYTQLFRSEGYEVGEDIENLKGLTKKDLQGMGITKRGEFVWNINFGNIILLYF